MRDIVPPVKKKMREYISPPIKKEENISLQ